MLKLRNTVIPLLALASLTGCVQPGMLQPSVKTFVSLIDQPSKQYALYYLNDKDELPTLIVLDVIGDGISFDEGNWLVAETQEARARLVKEAVVLGMQTYEIKSIDRALLRETVGYLLVEHRNLEAVNRHFRIDAEISSSNPSADTPGASRNWAGSFSIIPTNAAATDIQSTLSGGGEGDGGGGSGGEGGEGGAGGGGGSGGGGGAGGAGI